MELQDGANGFQVMFSTPKRLSLPSSRFSEVPFQVSTAMITYEQMLSNNEPDIILLVQGQSIPAHKHILARSGNVFYTMFYGAFKTQDVVEITDTSPEAMRLVVKALYETALTVLSNISIRMCTDCFMICHKYNIKFLEKYLSTLLRKKTASSNVFEILPYAKLLHLPRLLSKCWSVIERETSKALSTPEFLQCDWNVLNDVLENNRLRISEYRLAKYVISWCSFQRRFTKGFENKTLIEIIGVAVYKIRFPLMTRREFYRMCETGILLPREINDLKENFRKNTTFPNTARLNICLCLRNKTNCIICSKGQRSIQKQQGKLPNNNDPNFPNKIKTVEATSNNGAMCECQKYFSCPSSIRGLWF